MFPGTRQDIQQLAPGGRARPRRRLESLQRAMGSGCSTAIRRRALRIAGLASYVGPVRCDRAGLGGFLFSPIPRSPESRICYRRRPADLENVRSIAECLGSLPTVVLSLLRFLLLRDMAADILVAGARRHAAARSDFERFADAVGGVWLPFCRTSTAARRPPLGNR